jgi:NAD(P)-dependent dehydrogenase (short-subunit alcohol dehydrogenase family)
MPEELEGKTAGGTQGIGLATAKRFTEQGARMSSSRAVARRNSTWPVKASPYLLGCAGVRGASRQRSN